MAWPALGIIPNTGVIAADYQATAGASLIGARFSYLKRLLDRLTAAGALLEPHRPLGLQVR